MDMCTCKVALGGDLRNIVARGTDRPVSAPEIIVLQQTHGGGSVTDVRKCGAVERTNIEEKERLAYIYKQNVIERIFPGVSPQMPMTTDAPLDDSVAVPLPVKSKTKAKTKAEPVDDDPFQVAAEG